MPETTTTLDEARAALAAAMQAVRAAAAVFDGHDIKRELLGAELDAVQEATQGLALSASRSLNRWMTAEAGMGDEPGWHDCGGIFDAFSDTWNLEVVDDDTRSPIVIVDATDPVEANRRAVTWAVRVRGLGEALPADSAWLRVGGQGTREVTAGRWRVEIEGW